MEKAPKRQRTSAIQEKNWLFKEDWEDLRIHQGMDKIKRKAHFMSSLVLETEHWIQEVEKRRMELQHAGKLKRRAFSKIVKLSDRVTGREIGGVYLIPKVVHLMEQLKKEPLGYNTRLLLIHTLLESGRDFSVVTYRNIYLQACTLQALGYWSSLGILMTLKAQRSYFEKLILECRETKAELQGRLKIVNNHGRFLEQNNQIRELIRDFELNEKVLISFLDLSMKNLREDDGWRNKFKSSVTVSTRGLSEMGREFSRRGLVPQQQIELKREKLFLVMDMITFLLRHVPLLLPTAEQLVETYVSEIDHYQTGEFLRARILKSQLLFHFLRLEFPYALDDLSKQKLKKELHTLFYDAFKAYQSSLHQIGEWPETETEQEMVYDYCNLLSFYFRKAQQENVMKQTDLNRRWFASCFQQTVLQLEQTIPRLVEKKKDRFQSLSNRLKEDLLSLEPQLPKNMWHFAVRTMTAPTPVYQRVQHLNLKNYAIYFDNEPAEELWKKAS